MVELIEKPLAEARGPVTEPRPSEALKKLQTAGETACRWRLAISRFRRVIIFP
jgi:hypothetical protein